MKKLYYEKIGRRYVPVREYDSDFLDSFPKGSHLVMSYPGGKSTRYNVNPNYAALIAASRVAEDAMASALVKAGEIRMQRPDRERKLTPSQKAAWENLVKEFGNSAKQLEWPSAREVAEEGCKAMIEEADKLMSNPVLKKAFDHFQLVAKLVCDESKEK